MVIPPAGAGLFNVTGMLKSVSPSSPSNFSKSLTVITIGSELPSL